ncbi:nucleotidyltransferase family protein [Neptunomonas sp.]|uniref:nucleotidyltransferase domain-containing protein n=1 Tax=Neptunomonas sp. TaxID=1971898 RepID=UPI0025D97F1B|nr:nucleotidyltransferase family protein [Neptunomonas sp.]
MSASRFRPLCSLLCGGVRASDISLNEWNVIVQQGRSTHVLGMLYSRLKRRGQLSDVPVSVQWHLESASLVSEKYLRDTLLEVKYFIPVFAALKQPLILLKGAAYVTAGKPSSEGRTFSDIDLLVPKESLEELESALQWHGWRGVKQSAYDQRYYRDWMHEIPPLMHVKRQTVIDIHHTILPLTAALKPVASKLLSDAREVAEGVWALSDIDMLLHSATHLFMDTEFDHAFRDLLDFDGLVRDATGPDFNWPDLVARAVEMNLVPPLYYALRYSRCMFDTPMPENVLTSCNNHWQPALPMWFMDGLFNRVIMPPHDSARRPGAAFARKLLFVRGHYLRMPFGLLIRHLFHKAFISPLEKDSVTH